MPEDDLRQIREYWDFAVDAAWDQNRRHPELSRGTCLRERSFLHTLLGSNQTPLFMEACRLADRSAEKKQMQTLLPDILDYCRKRNALPQDPDGFEPGSSFRYEVGPGGVCYIHIRNGKKPDSFLHFPEYVAENLRRVMDSAARDHGCSVLYTASWLNSLPAFLHYFPQEWKSNISNTPAGDFGPTLGWQGQFINRAGFLNRATADMFLRTGVLPYPRVQSRCSFAAAHEHLRSLGL